MKIGLVILIVASLELTVHSASVAAPTMETAVNRLMDQFIASWNSRDVLGLKQLLARRVTLGAKLPSGKTLKLTTRGKAFPVGLLLMVCRAKIEAQIEKESLRSCCYLQAKGGCGGCIVGTGDYTFTPLRQKSEKSGSFNGAFVQEPNGEWKIRTLEVLGGC